jgi:glutamyl-tRNA reductase
MLHAIKLLHIQGNTSELSSELLEEKGIFLLKTCQRALIVKTSPISLNHRELGEYHEGKDAYKFLLETICGLKSKLQGESEIVSQFKEAYHNYLQTEVRSSVILRVLEKLFKDAKEIRRDYLIKIGQQSYAGIARRIVQTKYDSGKVLILGSGQLAKDVLKLLQKRYEISISARNQEAVKKIMAEYPQLNITYIPWEDHSSYQGFETIVNTIGAEITLFDHNFFSPRCPNKNIFIDLGSPSVIQTPYTKDHGVFRLTDIFSHGQALDQEKKVKIESAHTAIAGLVDRRAVSLGHNHPFSWEELQFAY